MCSHSGFRFLLVLPIFLLGASAFAQSPPFGPEGFAFTGKWSCNGHFVENGKSHVHRALYEGRTVSDGKWIDLSQKDIEPAGYDADFLMGYDRNNSEIVTFVGDNKGYALLTGSRWQGRSVTLTMTGQASYEGFSKTKRIPISRVTYEVKSADVYTVTWEMQLGRKSNEDDFLTCRRTNS